jgi:hypothetical protein
MLNIPSKTPPRSIILGDELDALGPKGGNLDFQKQVYLHRPVPAIAAISNGICSSPNSPNT